MHNNHTPSTPQIKTFALIDCNNFFVSCERIFRPDLQTKPVVVLSSNDGCVVARSNQAKRLGIPMGAPAFQYRQLFKANNVTQFSANFELYGNISKRITQILTQVTPHIELYSVDESFLDLSELKIDHYEAWAREVRARIWREVGVPVSIGIAPSKTLAKLASELAKHDDALDGTVSFIGQSKEFIEQALAATPIREVWGVGRKLAPKLQAEGVGNALALAQMRPQYAQKIMGIHGRQMVAELNGTSCQPLETQGRVAQSLMRSRTFGEDTNALHVLEAAIASLGTQAAFRLRTHGLLARRIGVFANTNRHKPGYKRWTRELTLTQPTADSGQIISLLVAKLPEIFSRGQQYHRLGVFLYDFVPASSLQTDLLGHVDPASHDRASARMAALDHINQIHGKGKIRYAAEDLAASWQPKRDLQSPHYVSNWTELPTVKIYNKTMQA